MSDNCEIATMQLRSLLHSVQLQEKGVWTMRHQRSPKAYAINVLNKLGIPTTRKARYDVVMENLEKLISKVNL